MQNNTQNFEIQIGMLRQWLNENRITDPKNMNREIKFRAWDKKNKKLIDFFAVKENGKIVIPVGNLHFEELRKNLKINY